MSDDRESFLARWSRRKSGIAAPEKTAPPREVEPPLAPATPPTTASTNEAEAAAGADAAAAEPPAPPLPTLADVAALTRDSDYTRFMAPGVDRTVRNAAMKKLFSDPHFNVMDGLDIYIDDYGKPDPLPLEMLRKLRQSEMLGLFADEAANGTADAAVAAAAEPSPDNPQAAPSPAPPMPTSTSPDARAEDDPDLRLQPDDGDRRPDAGEGPRP